MTTNTGWESIKAEGEALLEQLKSLVHEGNVRRVRIQHQGRTVAEFPLTAGVIGIVFAPIVAAVAVIVALLKDCTLEVQRDTQTETHETEKTEERPY